MIRNALIAAALMMTTGTVRAAEPAPPTPPAEVKELLGRLSGTWTAKEVNVQVDGKPCKGTSKVTCDRSADGYALTCKVHAEMGPMKIEEIALVGWDAKTGSLHLFSINNDGAAHDHKGTFGNDTLALEYAATTDGKPLHETLSFTFKNPRELTWKNAVTVAGQPVFAGEAVYKK